MKRIIGFLSTFILAGVLAHCHMGCKPATSAEEVNAAYTAETIACVSKATSKLASQTCRADVNKRYGLCEGQQKATLPCPKGN